MGMFSTVYNQCETLGEGLMGELQTKDLESMMDHYWLSPNGCLFLIDTSPCFRAERNPNPENPFMFFEWKPTGIRGRLRPYRRNFIARFYTANKEAHAFFRVGKLNMLLPNEEMYYHV
jgi:hypothetical protein